MSKSGNSNNDKKPIHTSKFTLIDYDIISVPYKITDNMPDNIINKNRRIIRCNETQKLYPQKRSFWTLGIWVFYIDQKHDIEHNLKIEYRSFDNIDDTLSFLKGN